MIESLPGFEIFAVIITAGIFGIVLDLEFKISKLMTKQSLCAVCPVRDGTTSPNTEVK